MTDVLPPVLPTYDMMVARPDAKFTDTLAKIVFGAPAHPDTWNSLFEPILGNTGYLKGRADKVDTRLDGLDVAISDVINASAIGITKVVTLQSELSSVRFAAELFLDGWRLVDSVAVPVTDSRGGDESIDVADTSTLRVGQSYVVTDSLGSEIITIAAILDGTRIRADADMPRTFAADAVLARTNWACFDQYAEAPTNGVYFSRPLNLGWDRSTPRTLIICSNADVAPEVAYKDAAHTDWTVVPWAWRRAADGHFEYAVPATGEFVLRITSNALLRIDWMFATSAPSQLGGTAAPPLAPRLTLPAEGAVGISETPTLTTAGFVSATGLTMAAAEWQVKRKTDEDWDNPLWSSTGTTTSTRLPAGVLAVNLSVVWRCRMQDTQGQWSDWTTATFTCAPEFKYIKTPSVTAPVDGAGDINAEATLTLTGSAFAVTGGSDSFAAQQWQVSDAFGTVWTSDEITTSGNVTLPADTLQPGWKSYTVQVRHKGAVLGWSEWSNPVTITTKGYTLEPATTTKLGGVMLATTAEATAGTNASKAVTPAGLKSTMDKSLADTTAALNQGFTTIVTLRSSGTWVSPKDGYVRVRVIGGGGSGSANQLATATGTGWSHESAGGGAGYINEAYVSVKKGQSFAVVIGAGGAPVPWRDPNDIGRSGNNGGASKFGSVSSGGGYGGSHSGGKGGGNGTLSRSGLCACGGYGGNNGTSIGNGGDGSSGGTAAGKAIYSDGKPSKAGDAGGIIIEY